LTLFFPKSFPGSRRAFENTNNHVREQVFRCCCFGCQDDSFPSISLHHWILSRLIKFRTGAWGRVNVTPQMLRSTPQMLRSSPIDKKTISLVRSWEHNRDEWTLEYNLNFSIIIHCFYYDWTFPFLEMLCIDPLLVSEPYKFLVFIGGGTTESCVPLRTGN
jgi:hypothetical protein